MANPESLTGRYLSGRVSIPVPSQRRKGSCAFVTIHNPREHNLKGTNVRIPLATLTCITGVSGSGKSTLLSILGLLEPPSSGDVLVAGQSVKKLNRRQLARLRGRKLGYVFQSFNLLAGLSVYALALAAWLSLRNQSLSLRGFTTEAEAPAE